MTKDKKEEVISFKVNQTLAEHLKGIENRSEFIRSAIFAALEGSCPLCKGSGILSLEQQQHWAKFARTHKIHECENCKATHIVCTNKEEM